METVGLAITRISTSYYAQKPPRSLTHRTCKRRLLHTRNAPPRIIIPKLVVAECIRLRTVSWGRFRGMNWSISDYDQGELAVGYR